MCVFQNPKKRKKHETSLKRLLDNDLRFPKSVIADYVCKEKAIHFNRANTGWPQQAKHALWAFSHFQKQLLIFENP